MSARLRRSLIDAEAALPAEAQERLAELIEAYTADHGSAPGTVFIPDEPDHVGNVAAEPFEFADPEEVRAFFARDGA